MVRISSGIQVTVTSSVPRSSGSDADSELDSPHGVKIYLPPSLFAYLVERSTRKGESLASMIVDMLYTEYESHQR
jgi:hypothetical protein